MAHPYTITIPGLVSAVRQLRSVFPAKVTADTLKRWEIAPNNEAYVIGVLRFLGIIDEEGKKIPEATKVFAEHDDAAFASKFERFIRNAYVSLFEHFGEKTWELDKDRLITFFRAEDESSAVVGSRQARTFQALAALAGHGETPAETQQQSKRGQRATRQVRNQTKNPQKGEPTSSDTPVQPDTPRVRTITNGGLTIRIEINLPVTDDQAIYDKIFQSIRANLINE